MLSSKEIRALSREQLKGNWSKFILINLVNLLAVGVCTYLSVRRGMPYMNVVQILIQVFVTLGTYKLMLDLANGQEFRFSNFWQPKRVYIRYLIVSILLAVLIAIINVIVGVILGAIGLSMMIGNATSGSLTFLGGLTLGSIVMVVVIGLIASIINIYIQLTYQMTELIVIKNHDDIGAIDSLTYSRKIMYGYKWRLFKLCLSFIGWAILSIASLGIGLLCLSSYIYMSITNFYLELLKEREELARDLNLVDAETISTYRTFVNQLTPAEYTSSKDEEVVEPIILELGAGTSEGDESSVSDSKLTNAEGQEVDSNDDDSSKDDGENEI